MSFPSSSPGKITSAAISMPDHMENHSERAIDGMQSFLDFFLNAIGAALCIALITSAILYLLRPLLGRLIQGRTISRWSHNSGETSLTVPEWLLDAARFHDIPHCELLADDLMARAQRQYPISSYLKTRPGQLRDELFMHALQTEVKASVARPSSAFMLFLAATSDAPPDARGAVAFFDMIARNHPDIAASIAAYDDPAMDDPAFSVEGRFPLAPSRSNSIAASLQAAEATLQSASDQFLDRLQLTLISSAIWPNRLFAILIGSGLAAAAAYPLQLSGSTATVCLLVGAAGGILSLFVSDALGLVAQRLAR